MTLIMVLDRPHGHQGKLSHHCYDIVPYYDNNAVHMLDSYYMCIVTTTLLLQVEVLIYMTSIISHYPIIGHGMHIA